MSSKPKHTLTIEDIDRILHTNGQQSELDVVLSEYNQDTLKHILGNRIIQGGCLLGVPPAQPNYASTFTPDIFSVKIKNEWGPSPLMDLYKLINTAPPPEDDDSLHDQILDQFGGGAYDHPGGYPGGYQGSSGRRTHAPQESRGAARRPQRAGPVATAAPRSP